jgi:hypothetical protein
MQAAHQAADDQRLSRQGLDRRVGTLAAEVSNTA